MKAAEQVFLIGEEELLDEDDLALFEEPVASDAAEAVVTVVADEPAADCEPEPVVEDDEPGELVLALEDEGGLAPSDAPAHAPALTGRVRSRSIDSAWLKRGAAAAALALGVGALALTMSGGGGGEAPPAADDSAPAGRVIAAAPTPSKKAAEPRPVERSEPKRRRREPTERSEHGKDAGRRSERKPGSRGEQGESAAAPIEAAAPARGPEPVGAPAPAPAPEPVAPAPASAPSEPAPAPEPAAPAGGCNPYDPAC